MTKIETEIAKFAASFKGRTAEERMLLKVLRSLPAAKQQAFISRFAAQELNRLARAA